MSFGSPLSLLALLVIPVALLALRALSRRPGQGPVAFTNLAVLQSVAVTRSRRARRLVPLALLGLALASAAAATARPKANLPTAVDNATIILLVDVSKSMTARDLDAREERLHAAVTAMRGFVDQLPKRFKVGLVQFSTKAQVMLAPTDDHARATEALNLLEAQSGTALGTGIATAISLIKESFARDHVVRAPGQPLPAVIVLLSDGKQTDGFITPSAAARAAHTAGIRIDTVALGTAKGKLGTGPFGGQPVPPDPATMRALARATGGQTATARNEAQLSSFYKTVHTSIGHVHRVRDISSWFAAATALLLLAAVCLGRAWAGALS